MKMRGKKRVAVALMLLLICLGVAACRERRADAARPMPQPSRDAAVQLALPQSCSVSPIVDAVSPAVVYIANIGCEGAAELPGSYYEQGAGSGVIISADGLIVTNNHVIDGADLLLVTLADGRQADAEVIGADARSDLALLRIGLTELAVAELGDSAALAVGDMAVAIGNPGGAQFARTTTLGIVSGLDRVLHPSDSSYPLIQTDAAINPGNSGGPLVNAAGQVIGITTVKISDTAYEGMGFAIPSSVVQEVAADLLEYGYVRRPALGVLVWGAVSPQLAEADALPVSHGVVVLPEADGRAAEAGLRDYDIIVEAAKQPVFSAADLSSIVQAHQVGDIIPLLVYRGDEQLYFAVELGCL